MMLATLRVRSVWMAVLAAAVAAPGVLVPVPSAGAGELPDLALVKEDHVPSVEPGEVFFYQLTYENNGAFAPNVVIRDTVPEGTRYEADGSTPGWSCADGAPAGTLCEISIPDLGPNDPGDDVVMVLRVEPFLPAGFDLIENTGSIRWFRDRGIPGEEPDLSDNVSTHTTPVDVSGIAPDLVVVKDDGGASASPGGVVAYQVGYLNAGTRGASGVVVVETVPELTRFEAAASSSSWSCADGAPAGTECALSVGTLQPGESGTATFAVRVDATIPAGVTAIENSVSIGDDGANGADLDPSDNVGVDTTPFEGPGAGPDLAVVKDDGGVTVEPGEVVAYQLAYSNLGPRGATGVVVTEVVPEHSTFEAGASSAGWSCSAVAPPMSKLKPERVQRSLGGVVCTLDLGTLESGDGGSAAFAVRVVDPVPGGVTEIVNTASIGDDGTNGADLEPADNSSTDRTPIDSGPGPGPGPGPGSGLEATAIDTAAGGLPASAGDAVAYTVVVANAVDAVFEEVELEGLAPAHTELLAGTVTTTRGSVVAGNLPGDESVRVEVGELGPGEEAVITFEVELDAELPLGLDEIAFQGTASAAGGVSLATDDPDTPEPGDPTRTPVTAGGPGEPAAIPSLSVVGFLAFAALLGGAGALRLRTRRA